MRTNKLIDQSLQALKDNLVLNLDWSITTDPVQKQNDIIPNGYIKLKLDGEKFKILYEQKNEVRKHQINQFKKLQTLHEYFVVIAGYIPENIRIQLKEEGINYIDRVGNCFLRIGQHHLSSSGKKNRNRHLEENKLFTATQLRLIFHLLQLPDLINTNYREIAKTASVSLDIVSKTINGLKKKGWLVSIDEQRQRLVDKKDILDRWLSGFEELLKPKLTKGYYRFLDEEFLRNWKQIQFNKKDILWGGEPAAALLTYYLKPERFLVYSKLNNKELLKQLKLIPDENGKVEIRELFYKPENFNYLNTVSALLVYTDLMISGDSRNQETAKILYDREISNIIE